MQRTLIGFGEAAQALCAGWAAKGLPPARAFDPRPLPAAHGVVPESRPEARAEVLAGAEMVFCLVTADHALQAACEGAPHLRPGTMWFDGNSCAPETKRRAAQVIAAAGGHYIDTAIMAPVHPRLHRTPLLIAGPEAPRAAPLLAALDMTARVVGPDVGQASSIKMLRSVMIKGMEALHAECFIAARKAGVEAEVLASLIASNPEVDWPRQGAYNLERMMSHGIRRAAEMREVVVTLQDLGMAGDLTAAVADWQQRIGQMGLKGLEGDLWTRCDLALDRL